MNDQTNAPIPTKIVRAGAIEALYDSGNLRYIRVGDEELIRGIYVALRDAEWGTFSPFISNEKVAIYQDRFTIDYKCQYKISGSPIFEWSARIEGNNKNELSYSIQGIALASFKKNRAGLCVLHPITSCVGLPCGITTPDGQFIQRSFPRDISPHQPFKNIWRMQWVSPQEVSCRIIFEGDVFETEDQRNWTDASFKTYSTPLELPFPVLMRKNDRIFQKIIFSAHTKRRPPQLYATRRSLAFIAFSTAPPLTIPNIGSDRPVHAGPIDHRCMAWLRQLKLDHYRIDLKLYDRTWRKQLQQGAAEASLLGSKLKVALHITKPDQLNDFTTTSSIKSGMITEILLHGPSKLTSDDVIGTYLPILKQVFPYTKIGGGTDCYFAELNRGRIDASLLDFIFFSINPQVHAFDNLTLIDNLAAQYDVVINASNLYPHIPIHISAVTLQPRFNPDAAQPYISGNMPLNNTPDSRQHSLFAAGWTLGSIMHLAAANTNAITYYEVLGDHGIIPAITHSSPPMISPVYLLFRLIREFKLGALFAGICNLPMNCTGIFMLNDQAKRWVVANHLPQTQQISIDNLTKSTRIRKLESDHLNKYMENPELFIKDEGIPIESNTIQLGPYGIAVLDEQ